MDEQQAEAEGGVRSHPRGARGEHSDARGVGGTERACYDGAGVEVFQLCSISVGDCLRGHLDIFV